MSEEWFTTGEAARYLRMHPVTVRKLLACGRIPGFQVTEPNGRWRIRRDSLDDFLSSPTPTAVRDIRVATPKNQRRKGH